MTETWSGTVSAFGFADIDFDATLQIGAGNNNGVQLHGRQLAWGGFSGDTGEQDSPVFGTLVPLALIRQGEVSALSEVTDILNASVDSTATAVVNNKAVAVAAAVPDNHRLIADVLQFSENAVLATSKVSAVSLQSYVNLGLIQRPVVASMATAVGNNLAMTVQSLAPVLRQINLNVWQRSPNPGVPMSFVIFFTGRLLMLRHGVDAAGFATGMSARLGGESDVAGSGDWLRAALR